MEDSTAALEYTNILASHGFVPAITKPTRTTKTTSSCKDHCFINTKHSMQNITAGVLHTKITDHDPIIIKIETENTSKLFQDKVNKQKIT